MAKRKFKKYTIAPRMQKFLDGEITVEDLDDEEIARGSMRSIDGDFSGRPTDMIPRKFYDALVAEQIRRWQLKVNELLVPALKTLDEIRANPKLPADARYKSAVYLIERAAGKVPEKTEMNLQVGKWEQDIHELIYEDADPKKLAAKKPKKAPSKKKKEASE